MRFKTRQFDRFTLGETNINAPASFQKPEGRQRAKNQTTSEKERYMRALRVQFRVRLRTEIVKYHATKQKDFNGLLKSLLAAKRLPRGVVTAAEASIKATGQEIQTFLNTNYRKKGLQTVDLWTDYDKNNFQDVKKSVVSDDGKDNNGDDGDDGSDEGSDEGSSDDEGADESEEEEEYEDDIQQRTCSTSLSSIIRKDLSPAVRQAFMDTLNATLTQVSNYMSDFSKQVLKTALLFNDYAFSKQDGRIALVPQEGDSLEPVLPAGYLDHTVHVPKPLTADCLKDADFSSDYSQLFQQPHLELIHSSYYGATGPQDSSLEASPLYKKILEVLPRDDHNPYQSVCSHAMKMVRQLYETNFQNMWASNTIVNKLLTRLLRGLLFVHLCPDKDQNIKAKKEERQDRRKEKGKQALRDTNASIPVESISLINMSRNGRRRLFGKERQRMNQYVQKGKTRAAERCQRRLDTYAQVLETERQERSRQRAARRQQQQHHSRLDVEDELVQDDIKAATSKDISRRRLGKIIQLARSALFSPQDISRAHIRKHLKNATEEEMVAIITIVRFIKPYLPSKVNYRSFAWQLPFVLMSNQVLRCIGRESQVVQITPIISPVSLKALVVDTATIFSLFCSNNAPSKMYLQDYSGHLIQEKSRLHHKDAVVGSFFDMAKIHTIAKSYGMEFGQRLQLLPGMKTVRINGTVRVTQTRPKVPETTTAEAGVPQDAEEDQEDDEPLKILNAQKETLQELLVDSPSSTKNSLSRMVVCDPNARNGRRSPMSVMTLPEDEMP